jgi:hypothetical protein
MANVTLSEMNFPCYPATFLTTVGALLAEMRPAFQTAQKMFGTVCFSAEMTVSAALRANPLATFSTSLNSATLANFGTTVMTLHQTITTD